MGRLVDMSYEGKNKRRPSTTFDVVANLGRYQKMATLILGLIISAGVVNGVYQFLKDAPAIVNANAREVRFHHDSIAANTAFQETVTEHLAHEDSADASRDRKLDYLICLRTERARERRGDVPMRDCDAELLG